MKFDLYLSTGFWGNQIIEVAENMIFGGSLYKKVIQSSSTIGAPSSVQIFLHHRSPNVLPLIGAIDHA